jgi:hypothetical protein
LSSRLLSEITKIKIYRTVISLTFYMGVKHGSVILSEEYRLRVSEPRRLGFAPGSVHVGFVVDRVAVGLGFSPSLGFPLSMSFHRGSPYLCTTWRCNNRPAVQRHHLTPIDMNSVNIKGV